VCVRVNRAAIYMRWQAVANTVWSLAVLAGPFLYAEEMAAIVEVTPPLHLLVLSFCERY
jgi:hypothetical protein